MYLRWVLFLILPIFHLFGVDFVLFTQPKTGTHLLKPILSDLTGKTSYCPRQYMKESSIKTVKSSSCQILEAGNCCPDKIFEEIWQTNNDQGSFLHFHTPYTKKLEHYLSKKRAVVFFVKRDPRDQIVSLLNHYKKFKFFHPEVEQLKTDEERLLYMIKNHMKDNLNQFKGWLSSPICCVLDFDKLMGRHGGAASDEESLNELKKLTEALELNFLDSELKEIYRKHFGRGKAFFRGKSGSWKDYFSEDHKIAVKEEIGLLLIELGFEKDLNW